MSTMDHKPSSNEEEYFARQNAELLEQQRKYSKEAADAAERRTHFMKCCKCGHDMATQSLNGVSIEMCTNCRGIYLDAGEIEQITKKNEPGFLGQLFSSIGSSLKSGVSSSVTSAAYRAGSNIIR